MLERGRGRGVHGGGGRRRRRRRFAWFRPGGDTRGRVRMRVPGPPIRYGIVASHRGRAVARVRAPASSPCPDPAARRRRRPRSIPRPHLHDLGPRGRVRADPARDPLLRGRRPARAARAPARRRVYGERERTRTKLILRGKRLGLSLFEIREILDLHDRRDGDRRQLERFLEVLEHRRRALAVQREDIDALLAEIASIERDCRRRLKDASVPPDRPARGSRPAGSGGVG